MTQNNRFLVNIEPNSDGIRVCVSLMGGNGFAIAQRKEELQSWNLVGSIIQKLITEINFSQDDNSENVYYPDDV